MSFLIGTLLALGVGALSTWIGFDRDRAFYPTVMIVIASYYVLFAAMGGSSGALLTRGALRSELAREGEAVLADARRSYTVGAAFLPLNAS